MASRTVTLNLVILPAMVDGECGACHFDALVRFKIYNLTSSGVTTMRDTIECGRCLAEKRRQP